MSVKQSMNKELEIFFRQLPQLENKIAKSVKSFISNELVSAGLVINAWLYAAAFNAHREKLYFYQYLYFFCQIEGISKEITSIRFFSI